jgi:hypothetical protein
MPFLLRMLFALWLVLLFLSRFSPPAIAQEARDSNTLLQIPSLRQLTRNSGYIFAGTVTAVERVAPVGPNEVATMRITFRVEQAIRGVRTGQTLVIREWTGLWESGKRYHTGEHLLLFLYRPSKLGLTSPVGGSLGRFAIDSNDQVILNPERADALSSDPALSDPAIETGLRGKSRWSSRELVRAIRRAAEE